MAKPDEAAAPAEGPESRAAAIAYLTESVLPALEQARAALAKSGVTATVETNWTDPAANAEPMVSFSCGERGIAGPDLAAADVVELDGSGGSLGISTAAGGRRQVERGRAQQAIEEAVRRAVSAYYTELEDTVR